MFSVRRLLLVLMLSLFVTAARAQMEMSVTYVQQGLDVSIPYYGLRPGAGRLSVELLSPEDRVLARFEHAEEGLAEGGVWKARLVPDSHLAFEDLVWERVRFEFVFKGEQSPALTEVRSVSTILRRPFVHVLGQTEYLAGSRAALRVLVNDGTAAGAPIASGSVRVELVKPETAARSLFAGKLDHRGTVSAEFQLPAGLAGEAQLRIVAETVVGRAESTITVHLQDKVSILLTTEKPLYQPSQTIHVRALALDRADHHAAGSRTLTFELEDARGNKIFRKATETDAFGVASAEFPLADEVNLGAWHLRALLAGGEEAATQNTAEVTLHVERYVLPKFRVSVNFAMKDGKPQRDFRPGDHITGTVEAKYFFGKPVDNAEISLKASGMDAAVFEAAKAEGRTDAQGRYSFDLRLPAYFAGRGGKQGLASVVVEATVRDTAGHAETRGEPVTVTESALLIQAVPESGVLLPGFDNVVYVMTSYPDGTPAAATVRVKTQEHSAQTVETGANGIGILHLQGGLDDEQLKCVAEDRHGKRASATLRLEAKEGEDQVMLRTDRAVYKAGDAIHLDVFSTLAHGTAYVDVVKDSQTLLTRDVDVSNGRATLTVPATATLAGTVEVSAYVFGADGRAIHDHRIVFVQPAEELHIEAHADAASYLPGSEAHVHFHVTDAKGRGVEAAFGLEVVDEAVFALAEKQPGFAKVFFYLEQELMTPRVEIHSLSASDVVAPQQGDGEATSANREQAARVLFAAAASLNPHTLDTTFGQGLPEEGRQMFADRYFDAFSEQAAMLADDLRRKMQDKGATQAQSAFASVRAQTAFLSLRGSDGRAEHDAWDTPLHLEAARWDGRKRYFRLVSAGPDRQFDTADDLTATIDVVSGTVVMPNGSGTIGLRLEHAHGAFNGLAEAAGSVMDASGAVIPGARVLLRALDSGAVRRATTDGSGRFLFAGLPPAEYRVVITSQGFMTATRTFTIEARDVAVLDATLQVGAVSQTVDVMVAAPMLMTEMSSVAVAGRGMAGAAFAMPSVATLMVQKAGAGSTTQTEAHTRSYFPEALYIAPEIITDSHGAATVSIPMADSITTWRMAMIASTKSGALGTATSSLKVFQDFFVDLDLPVTITQGDRISIPVAIYNYAGKRDTVQLRLQEADWFGLPDGGGERSVEVAPDAVGGSQFTIEAKHVGVFKLTLAAHMGDRQDTVVREIEVVPNGQPQEHVVNGRLDGQSQTAAAETTSLPASALPEGSKLFVRLYPGPLSQLVEGMDGVLRMPYGCFEQTSSSTYPNVLALDYMKRAHKLTPEVHAKAEGFIATGYQRLLTFEVRGGGFSWFGEAPANKILTAYGLMEFHDMSAVHGVDERVIERTRDWLIAQQKVDGSWAPDTTFINEGATDRFNKDLVRITAYIAWSLESSGYDGPAIEKARGFLQKQFAESSAKLDPYTLAVLANFAVDGKADPAWTHTILERLKSAAQQGDGQLWWSSAETGMYATGTSAEVETTGLAVQALLKSGEDREAARKALAWLLSKKSGDGNWGSTQATIMALRALVMASEQSGGDASGSVDVMLNGSTVKTVMITKDNNDLLQQLVLPAGVSDHVELRFHGTGGLAYQIASRYFVPWNAHEAKSALSIDVAYDRTKLAENNVVTATATVHSNLDKKANMVMVDLGIPPGFSLDTEDLQAMIERTAHARTGRLEKFNLTATQAILYFDSLGANETIKIRVRLRAKYPIKATSFASRVYEYYDPAVSATARPQEFEVVAK